MAETTHRWNSVLEADMHSTQDPLAPRTTESLEAFTETFGEAVEREGEPFAADLDELDLYEQLRGARRRLARVLSGAGAGTDSADDL